MSAEAAIRAALARGELRTAHRLASRWVAAEPASSTARQLWAQLTLDLKLARTEAERLELQAEATPADPRPRLTLVQHAYARGDVSEARQQLQRLLAAAPVPPVLAAAAGLAEDAADRPILRLLLKTWARAAPSDPTPLVHAARLEGEAGNKTASAALLATAVQRAPRDVDLLLRLAHQRAHLGDAPGAVSALETVRAEAPDTAEVQVQAGRTALFISENTLARAAFDRARALDPARPDAAWGRAAAAAPVAEDATDEGRIIADYRAALQEVCALDGPDTPASEEAWRVATHSAFVRHYHGGDCLSEQRDHARLLQRAVSGVQRQLAPPAPSRSDRIRVAFVTSYLYRHTISKLFVGWMQHLDRDRFAVSVLSCSHFEDEFTAAVAEHTPVHRLPGDLLGAARAVLEHQPDVVIFPELGMDPFVLQLAALRLAPQQMLSWGHPVTTGLSTVDVFLSSQAMAVEPDRAWTTETRVDLPGLSICYDRPSLPDGSFDLPLPDAPLALCVQNLRKYRPFTDALHVEIARRAPEARLVFVSSHRPALTQSYWERLGRAFDRAGLVLDDHAVLLPRLTQARWMHLMAAGTLFLDGPGWSGGNTALEAFAAGTPCLAFPGDTFRGRHSLGMVRELGLPSLEGQTAEDYVDKAVHLLTHPRHCQAVTEEAAQRCDRLYGDLRGVRALEALLIERCR